MINKNISYYLAITFRVRPATAGFRIIESLKMALKWVTYCSAGSFWDHLRKRKNSYANKA